ncbi:hypothetical protein MTQ10_13255 [Streptomyces sp. XM83C]|nr:hypothetical protein [Streptomyces sp. XM83C]MCK1820551.1 hypothetical protein [Streptomyces sp. XM83C]
MMHDPERENGTGPWDGSRPEVLGGPGEERPGRRPPAQMWRRGSRRGRAVVAATTVAVLAVGGTAAYAATSDGSGTPSATASSSSSPDTDRKHDHRDGRFGRGGPGVHGEATVKDPDSGDWVVRTWQRGTVEKVDGDQVTVRSDDDTSWTWTVDEDSAVHRFTGSDPDSDDDASDGSGPGSLQKDDKVVVVGTRTGDDTRTASHVIAGDPDDLEDRLHRFKDDLKDDLDRLKEDLRGRHDDGPRLRGPHGRGDGPSDDRTQPTRSGSGTAT